MKRRKVEHVKIDDKLSMSQNPDEKSRKSRNEKRKVQPNFTGFAR